MTQVFATLLILSLVWSIQQLRWPENPGGPLTPATMMVGFILLVSYMGGKAAFRIRLPKVSGYLFIGILLGPYAFALISHETTEQLQLINGLALSLIALTAGGELNIRRLRPMWKSLLGITFFQMISLWIVFVGIVFLLRPWFPFLEDQSWKAAVVTGMILGSIAIASSPSVAVAIINECRARGPVTETVLSVSVLKDVFVIMLFTPVLLLGRSLVGPDIPLDFSLLGKIAFEIFGSIAAGVFLGFLILLYLKFVNAESTLFILGICLISAKLGLYFRLEPALIALTAGFFMENTYPDRGGQMIRAVERGSLPVYALFFCLAGAVLNLRALKEMWFLALALVCLRLVTLFASTCLGACLGGADENIGRYGWLGYIAQAGVSLGLVAMLLLGFPEWGEHLRALVISIIALNQLIGPIGFRYALIRSKEAVL